VAKDADRVRAAHGAAGAAAEPPRWLIIVESGRLEVHESLRQGFEHDPGVQVIIDRRRTDRRQGPGDAQPDRRSEQRRRPPPETEVAFGKNAGFFLIVRR
jgi:hypothetical protein